MYYCVYFGATDTSEDKHSDKIHVNTKYHKNDRDKVCCVSNDNFDKNGGVTGREVCCCCCAARTDRCVEAEAGPE